MIEALGMLAPVAQYWLFAGIVVFLRVGAAMTVVPAFGERSVPQRIRLVLALALTVILLPMLQPTMPDSWTFGWLVTFALTETLIGVAFGLALRLFVLVLQIAGSIAAQSTSLAQIFAGSNTVEPQPAIGHVLVVAGLALAVLNDLHLKLVEAFLLTYQMFPPGDILASSAVAQWGTERVASAFALAFSLAAPFMIAAFLYNIALGVINKAMPQLMVALVGAPAITAAGLILLLLTAPYLLGIWQEALTDALRKPFGVL